uniref:Alpha-carbonic anhydrase domain-containing protein n=1 Tax=Periophthalmus magnuspinnatus TaxID=409849 RepID=A0A3B3ZTQ5_9GOBI
MSPSLLGCKQTNYFTFALLYIVRYLIFFSLVGTLNQKNWAKKFPSCSNARQSPINIEESLAQVKLQYQALLFEGWDALTSDATTIKNDGKTVAVNIDGDFYVSGGGLQSTFKVGRITFHWGRCNATSDGSEHSLNGVKYPLEDKCECTGTTIKIITITIVITILNIIKTTSRDTTITTTSLLSQYLISCLPLIGKTSEVSPFALRGLLPNSTEKFFLYNGSLTTPPCSETVEWIVFKNTVSISDEQVNKTYETANLHHRPLRSQPITHSYSTFILHIHTPHSYSTFILHIHTPHSYSTFILNKVGEVSCLRTQQKALVQAGINPSTFGLVDNRKTILLIDQSSNYIFER